MTTTGAASGITLSYSGPSANTSSGNGVTSPFGRSTETQTAWTALTGGDSYSNVNAQGLAYGNGQGNFTLSGLTVGQDYSVMVLFGVGNSGSNYASQNMRLQLSGIESDYTYTNFDSVNTAPTYTPATETVLAGTGVGSGVAGSFQLNFTASSTNLVVTVGGSPSRQGIQAIALQGNSIIPEPSTALLGGLSLLILLRRKK